MNNIDAGELAARAIYNATTYPPARTPARPDDQAALGEEAAAQVVYDNPKSGHAPAPPAKPTGDVARDLYTNMYGKQTLAELAEAAEPDDEDARADVLGLSGTFQDIGFSTADIALLAATTRAARTASEDDVAAWRAQAERETREKYGTRYMQVMDDARRMVARDPVFRDLLGAGPGNHPAVVARVVEAAQAARRAGKLN